MIPARQRFLLLLASTWSAWPSSRASRGTLGPPSNGTAIYGPTPDEALAGARLDRRDDVIVDLGDDFRFETDDAIFICGSPEATRRFEQELA